MPLTRVAKDPWSESHTVPSFLPPPVSVRSEHVPLTAERAEAVVKSHIERAAIASAPSVELGDNDVAALLEGCAEQLLEGAGSRTSRRSSYEHHGPAPTSPGNLIKRAVAAATSKWNSLMQKQQPHQLHIRTTEAGSPVHGGSPRRSGWAGHDSVEPAGLHSNLGAADGISPANEVKDAGPRPPAQLRPSNAANRRMSCPEIVLQMHNGNNQHDDALDPLASHARWADNRQPPTGLLYCAATVLKARGAPNSPNSRWQSDAVMGLLESQLPPGWDLDQYAACGTGALRHRLAALVSSNGPPEAIRSLAAVIIQSYCRGWQARKYVARLREERRRTALEAAELEAVRAAAEAIAREKADVRRQLRAAARDCLLAVQAQQDYERTRARLAAGRGQAPGVATAPPPPPTIPAALWARSADLGMDPIQVLLDGGMLSRQIEDVITSSRLAGALPKRAAAAVAAAAARMCGGAATDGGSDATPGSPMRLGAPAWAVGGGVQSTSDDGATPTNRRVRGLSFTSSSHAATGSYHASASDPLLDTPSSHGRDSDSSSVEHTMSSSAIAAAAAAALGLPPRSSLPGRTTPVHRYGSTTASPGTAPSTADLVEQMLAQQRAQQAPLPFTSASGAVPQGGGPMGQSSSFVLRKGYSGGSATRGSVGQGNSSATLQPTPMHVTSCSGAAPVQHGNLAGLSRPSPQGPAAAATVREALTASGGAAAPSFARYALTPQSMAAPPALPAMAGGAGSRASHSGAGWAQAGARRSRRMSDVAGLSIGPGGMVLGSGSGGGGGVPPAGERSVPGLQHTSSATALTGNPPPHPVRARSSAALLNPAAAPSDVQSAPVSAEAAAALLPPVNLAPIRTSLPSVPSASSLSGGGGGGGGGSLPSAAAHVASHVLDGLGQLPSADSSPMAAPRLAHQVSLGGSATDNGGGIPKLHRRHSYMDWHGSTSGLPPAHPSTPPQLHSELPPLHHSQHGGAPLLTAQSSGSLNGAVGSSSRNGRTQQGALTPSPRNSTRGPGSNTSQGHQFVLSGHAPAAAAGTRSTSVSSSGAAPSQPGTPSSGTDTDALATHTHSSRARRSSILAPTAPMSVISLGGPSSFPTANLPSFPQPSSSGSSHPPGLPSGPNSATAAAARRAAAASPAPSTPQLTLPTNAPSQLQLSPSSGSGSGTWFGEVSPAGSSGPTAAAAAAGGATQGRWTALQVPAPPSGARHSSLAHLTAGRGLAW